MHVGLNLVFLVPGETGGMETVARALIPRLASRDDLRITAFVNRETAGEDLGVPTVTVPVHARSRVQWVAGEQALLPRLARRAGVDVLHSMGGTAPMHGRFRRVVTIHDLNYRMIEDAHFGLYGLGMRVLVPGAARSAHRIVTVSEASRDDLVSHLGVPAGKVDVVPNGVELDAPTPTPARELRGRLGLGDRDVLLSVSGKKPHKNLLRLFEALARVPTERRPLLVVPGYRTPHVPELEARIAQLGLQADVVMPEWLDGADLEGLYALAQSSIFPSLYEGFGLPVLEAMARGVAVACSDRGALAEVSGDAALHFDPEDVDAIRAAIERLPAEAERLRRAGVERARAFTWDRAAELTAAAYRRA